MEVSPSWVKGFEAGIKGEETSRQTNSDESSYRQGYEMGRVAQQPDQVADWLDRQCQQECKDEECIKLCKKRLLSILYFAIHIVAHPNQPHYRQTLAAVAQQMNHWKEGNGYPSQKPPTNGAVVPTMEAKSFFEWTKNLSMPHLQQYLEEQGLIGPHAPVDLVQIMDIMTSKEADLTAKERADRMLQHLKPFIRDRLLKLKDRS